MSIRDELAKVEKEKAADVKRKAELEEFRKRELEKEKKNILNMVKQSLQELEDMGFKQEMEKEEDVFSCKKDSIVVKFEVRYYSTTARYSDDTDPVPVKGYQCSIIVRNNFVQYDRILYVDGCFDKTIAEFLGKF